MQISTPSLFSIGLQGLNRSNQLFAQSAERLSTGLRINRGSDDPSGLIASEAIGNRLMALGAQTGSLVRSNMNLAIQDGALSAASSSINGLQSLVVQGANAGALTGAESGAISTNANGIMQGLNFATNQPGGEALTEVLGNVSIQREIGTDPGTGDPIYETLTLSDLPGLIESDPQSAQALVDEASGAVAMRQAEIGAEQRSNESMQRAMEEEQINLARAQSSIRDTDYAKEASNSVRASILSKASISVLLIGQQQSNLVLDLLESD